jgi:urocanate hydratase
MEFFMIDPVVPIPVPPPPATPTSLDDVQIISAWASKINWAQAVGGASMLLAYFTGGHVGLDASQQGAIVVVIGLATQVFTWISRTWFTKEITKSSVPTT